MNGYPPIHRPCKGLITQHRASALCEWISSSTTIHHLLPTTYTHPPPNTNAIPWGIPPNPSPVHLITIEFPHDSGKSRLASLSSHCSFISLAQRKGTKETSPNQGLPPREGCNLLRAETALRKSFGKFYEASALKGKTCIDYLIVSEWNVPPVSEWNVHNYCPNWRKWRSVEGRISMNRIWGNQPRGCIWKI